MKVWGLFVNYPTHQNLMGLYQTEEKACQVLDKCDLSNNRKWSRKSGVTFLVKSMEVIE